MSLDDSERNRVNKLEHTVRHILGLYDSLARHLLNVIPDSEAGLRSLVQMHADRVPELVRSVTTQTRQLLEGSPAEPNEGSRGTDHSSGGG